MAESRFNKVWNILSNYNFEINEDVSEDVLCGICKKIMIEPYIASCGCHYCCRCIKDYIGEELKHCPGGQKECSEDFLDLDRNVYTDLRARRNIMNMMINCPNDSCVFRTKFEDMDEHIRICSLKPVECPYKIIGCVDEGVREDNVENHLNLEVLKHTNMLIDAINNLRNDVNRLDNIVEIKEREINELKEEINKNKEDIEEVKEDYRRKEILMREEIEEMKEEIRTLKDNEIRMEYQSEVMKADEMVMKEDIDLLKENIVEYISEFENKEMVMTELLKQMSEQREEIDILNNNKDVGIEYVLMKEKEKNEANFGDLSNEYNENEKNSRKRDESIYKTINSLIFQIKQSKIDDEREYIWRVNNISKRKVNNDKRIYKILYKQSYKFKLYVMCGNYLYFDCIIMKGKYDNIIKWPMKHEITLSILNQQTMEIYKYIKYKYDTYNYNKEIFNKPTTEYNAYSIGDGYLLNMKNVEDIPGILVNDSILLSFTMDYQ